MEVRENEDDTFTCVMSRDEFVGVFRTIGATNHFERMSNKESRLSEEESRKVGRAYWVAFTTIQSVFEDDRD